jgi:hypothetical protein
MTLTRIFAKRREPTTPNTEISILLFLVLIYYTPSDIALPSFVIISINISVLKIIEVASKTQLNIY